MDADFLWKAIVPLGLLAIWALTAITNRNSKPLPGGRTPSTNPYAPPPPLNRPAAPSNPPVIRWAPLTVSNLSSKPPRPGGFDDDIVIIDSSQSSAHTGNQRGVSPTKRNRSRQTGTPTASKTADVNPKSALTNVSQTVNQQIASSMVIKPLSETTVGQPVQRSASANASQPLDMEGENFGLERVKAAFSNRQRIREAIILNEILQPPISLRNKRRNS